MLKITEAGSDKVTYVEPPNELKERLQDAKNKAKKKPSVLSKLVNVFKDL